MNITSCKADIYKAPLLRRFSTYKYLYICGFLNMNNLYVFLGMASEV